MTVEFSTAHKALPLSLTELRTDPRSGKGLAEVHVMAPQVSGTVSVTAHGGKLQGLEGLVGRAACMTALRKRVALVAGIDAPVMITGETGTGKERVAEAVHLASSRAQGPFVRLYCGGLSAQHYEEELFGTAERQGYFARARGGTLLLDEVSELLPAMQARITHALRELGHDVRVLATASRDLRVMAVAGTFREDLYQQLHVLDVEAPPLRAHRDDVPMLAEHVAQRVARALGLPAPELTPEAVRSLARYHWPGNVRELENVLERALVFAQGSPVTVAELPARLAPGAALSDRSLLVPGATFAEIERRAILETFEACGGNITRTAKVLALSPRTIHYRLREYRGETGRRKPNKTPRGAQRQTTVS